jgi:hypothetical protein
MDARRKENAMSLRPRVIILTVLLLLSPALARADEPRAVPEGRNEEATHIVCGRVKTVYSAERQTAPGHVDSIYVLEVRVERVDKGKGPKVDEPLYVRSWKSKKRPPGFTGPTGQTMIPKADEYVFLYFNLNRDGGYDLINLQGTQTIQGGTEKP